MLCSQSVHIFSGFTIEIITHFPRIFIIFFTAVRFRLYRVTRLKIIGEANTNNFLAGGETLTQKTFITAGRRIISSLLRNDQVIMGFTINMVSYSKTRNYLYTNARARLQTSPAAEGSCSLTNCKHIFGFYYKKTLLHFMNTTCDESHYYKHSVVKGRCKHNCKFYPKHEMPPYLSRM